MTKEEILKNHVSLYFSSHHDKSRWNGEGEHGGAEWHTDKAIAPDIHKAMDEYAKQQAIEFSNWQNEGCYLYNTNPTGWCILNENLETEYVCETTEQLYDQFIESQNK
jgi:hypothetical protein